MSNYHIKHLEEYFSVYRKSVRDPELFWSEVAEEHFMWRKKWDHVLDWDFDKAEISWFKGVYLLKVKTSLLTIWKPKPHQRKHAQAVRRLK